MAFPNVKARMAYYAKQKDQSLGQAPGSMGQNLTSKPNLGTPKIASDRSPHAITNGLGMKPTSLALPKEPSMPKAVPNEPKSPMLPKMAKFPKVRKFFK